MNQVEVNALEQDALEVLSLVRSVRNSFAPVNRIPPEILSFTPDYYSKGCPDQDLLVLTHVCRSWRNTFVSRSSLWTRLDFRNVGKTRTYIRRSKSSPLQIYLVDSDNTHSYGAFSLVTPYIHRLKSMVIHAGVLPDAIGHFCCRAPLLEELDISFTGSHAPVLDNALFRGDLSSLRKLSLDGVITYLPWNNLANLTTFVLKFCPPQRDFITRLLNVFECAPLLHTILLEHSIPTSSNAPPRRIISLPHLRALYIIAQPAHSILLNHLCIPTGASLGLGFVFGGGESPLQDYLPETLANLKNISQVTAINLRFGATQKYLRLSGPSGELRVLAHWEEEESVSPCTMDRRILRSLSPHLFLTTQRLAVSKYNPPRPKKVEKCPVFQTLCSMASLRTLILTKCHNLPFIFALNPEKSTSKLVLCPDLENIILYIESRDDFHIGHLLSMAKQRAARGVKLSSITIVGLDELVSAKEVFGLREHVTRVNYRAGDVAPNWDYLPGDSSDESE